MSKIIVQIQTHLVKKTSLAKVPDNYRIFLSLIAMPLKNLIYQKALLSIISELGFPYNWFEEGFKSSHGTETVCSADGWMPDANNFGCSK